MTIKVKQVKSYDPWLAILCVVLALSTVAFALLAVRNATPFTCDSYERINDSAFKCIKVIKK